MKHITDYININESNEYHWELTELEKIKYIRFSDEFGRVKKTLADTYSNIESLVEENYTDEDVEYPDYKDVYEVVKEIQKLKVGQKLIIEYRYPDEPGKRFYEMVLRVK